ncbi:MAG: UDP-N-acetylmuramoyl-L-alanyl-D-glutamate--2,6-diaminopimelate ligase [Alphaproteobacteria bacterium]|nr:UDP-N-acetylmuramoyl-L-alanyl-D-glutamate--2,6-diaminopimelate ligase [Alphaproteobacteria bacterium]
MDPAIGALDIRGLAADSGAVHPGFLFAALTGSRTDGRTYIADARKRGAVALLGRPDIAADAQGMAFIADANPRLRLARMAAAFYGAQPRTVAAVTGTNGKTSTVTFARQLWTALGRRAASLGTLGVAAPDLNIDEGLTTPDPIALHDMLAKLAKSGVDHAALEASSHGLDQFRLDGVRVSLAAFTNLTRDHLDYHHDMNAYRTAKLRLFGELLAPDGAAVLNADADGVEHFQATCAARALRVLTYGERGTDLRLEAVEARPNGQRIVLNAAGTRHDIFLPLVARFQAMNALCALGLVTAGGEDMDKAVAALPALHGVPGRVQRVSVLSNGAGIYVDYAHTPDALETVLRALRPHAARRLSVIFGCGGDRDPGKRPLMGDVARRLADDIFVTDDNPRSENPAEIRRQILAACPDAKEFDSRADAIGAAVAALQAGDVLVVAGKGHERYQIVGDKVLPFDDAAIAADAARARGGRA